MKFLSFIIIFAIVILTVSIKLIIANQEGTLKQIKAQIIAVDEKIEKKTSRYFILNQTTAIKKTK